MSITIFCLTHSGGILGERVRMLLPGSMIHGLVDRVPNPDVAFIDVRRHVEHVYAERRAIIAICATVLCHENSPLVCFS